MLQLRVPNHLHQHRPWPLPSSWPRGNHSFIITFNFRDLKAIQTIIVIPKITGKMCVLIWLRASRHDLLAPVFWKSFLRDPGAPEVLAAGSWVEDWWKCLFFFCPTAVEMQSLALGSSQTCHPACPKGHQEPEGDPGWENQPGIGQEGRHKPEKPCLSSSAWITLMSVQDNTSKKIQLD